MQKKIAIVNDFSGYGRCSVTVALPILSAMGIHCGIIPTAILSNHTEYPDYSMLDFTPYMSEYIDMWKKMAFRFDGIYTGFLGSSQQIDILLKLLSDFDFQQIVVDPVMGDHGVIYDSYTQKMCDKMKLLIKHASLITPNFTELCKLTDHDYVDAPSSELIETLCKQVATDGPKQIVVTGLESGDQIGNAIYDNGSFSIQYVNKIQPLRPGTGDVFASIVSGCMLQEMSLIKAVEIAADFITTCLSSPTACQTPINDGVCFEEHLHQLTRLSLLA